jgi:hypothetical protein
MQRPPVESEAARGPLSPPLPKGPVPAAPPMGTDDFVFEEEANPLSRMVADIPVVELKTAYKAMRVFQYDARQHSGLQDVLDRLEPFVVLRLPEGEYEGDLRFSKPIYVQTMGSVSLHGTMACAGDFIVFEGLTIAQSDPQKSAVSVAGGYTSLMMCMVVSSLVISGSASSNLYVCDLSGSGSNPVLRVTDDAICEAVETSVHDSKGVGISVDAGLPSQSGIQKSTGTTWPAF